MAAILNLMFDNRYAATLPKSLRLEMPYGQDAGLAWGSIIEQPVLPGKKRTAMCLELKLQPDGREPSMDELSRSRILSAVMPDGLAQPWFEAWAADTISGIRLRMERYQSESCPGMSWDELDPGARPMVRYFNDHGLPTKLSCAGHPGTPMKRFWIELREDVTDMDVARFMEAHTPEGRGFTAHGMFCARYDKAAGSGIVKTLQYSAVDQDDAANDLSDWMSDDLYGGPEHRHR